MGKNAIEKIIPFILLCENKCNKYMGLLYIVIASFLFAVGSLIVKLISETPVYQTIYYSSLISLVFCAITDQSDKIPKNNEAYKLLLKRGIYGSFGLICFYEALIFLPLSICTLLSLTIPLWVGIIGRIFYEEVYNFVHFLLTISCFIGLILIIKPSFLFDQPDEEPKDDHFVLGIIFGILCSVVTAVIFLTITALKGKVSVIVILFYFNFFSIIVGALGSQYEDSKTLSFCEILIVFLAGFFFFLAQAARNRSLYLEKPFVIGLGSYSQLIMTYIMDIIFFGLSLDYLSYMGCVIIVVCMIILIFYNNSHQK